jgi:uncharacterized phage protein gp47/JayE
VSDIYIELPIDTDPEDVLADAYAQLQDMIPGWQPASGNLDVWILMAISATAAESREVVSTVSKSIFRWYGNSLVNIPPVDAAPAYATTTWTVVDANGYFIPGGTQVGISDPDTGEVIPFETQADYTVPPGVTMTPAGDIQIIATDPGADGNSLGPDVELIDPLNFVTSIVTVAPTSGGQDAESDDDYLNRLTAELQLMAPRPILPNDFAVFARDIPGAWRALAIDLYNPGPPPTTNTPRCVTIIAVDQNGQPVSSTVKAAIDADLQARREVNFLVFEADATLTQIDVTYTAVALAGYDKPTLMGSINTALQSYLSPATWGTLQNDTRAWRQITVVRYLEIAQVINDTNGVDYISTLTLGIHGGSMASSDVNLPGLAPLPEYGTITGTVN